MGVFVGVLVGVFVAVGVGVGGGGGQVSNGIGPAKSLSVAVNDADDRVCGRKVLMQPVNPRPSRSIPPSMSSFWLMESVGS